MCFVEVLQVIYLGHDRDGGFVSAEDHDPWQLLHESAWCIRSDSFQVIAGCKRHASNFGDLQALIVL